ncbi:MAG TPA: response regulator [Trueperaceae bacterium]|nr:response regulator [Trueperaceae bacterium]
MAGAKILVADDAEGQRMLLEMLLSADGHEVHAAADGREALAYLKVETPDLAVLDVAMPFITGIDVCHRMKRVPRLKRVPVIILTALTDERTREMARMARADAVVPKPLEGKDFRATVTDLLAAARSPP